MDEEPRNSSLILASGSPSRRELLGRLGLPFRVEPATIDESPREAEAPEALVERLSRSKAAAVARLHPTALVIGSDQVAVFDGEATSKPGSVERAHEFLERFSGQEVCFITGVCLLSLEAGEARYFRDRTVVRFRELSAGEIRRYVASDNPLECAGGFKVESLGPSLFREVRSSDPTALPGLPLIRLAEELRRHGYALP